MDTSTTTTICNHCFQLNRVRVEASLGQEATCGKCKKALSCHDGVTDVSHAGLKAFLGKTAVPVVVDFWAPWCGPCRAFAPTFIQVAGTFAGRVIFLKIDTEEHPEASQEFHVQGIPTLAMFKAGIERDRVSGALPPTAFTDWIVRLL